MSLDPIIRSVEAVVADSNVGDRTITARVNTNGLDRFNSVLDPRGAKLENYRRSGILLWEHGRDPRRGTDPIGKALWIKPNSPTNPTAIIAKYRFLNDDFSDQRYRWYVDGVLDSFSVRALPLSYRAPTKEELRSRPELNNDRPNETRGQFDGPLIYDDWEVGEVSSISVAGNPECIVLERALTLKQLSDTGQLWLPEDVLPAIEERIRTSVSVPRTITDSGGGLAGGGATVKPDDDGPRKVERVIVEENGKFFVYSEDRKKRLGGPYDSRGEAEKRLEQVDYFKEKGEGRSAPDADADETPTDPVERSEEHGEDKGEPDHEPGKHKPTHGVKKRGNKWVVVANSGRLMGEYDSKEEAEQRVKDIEYFKHAGRSAPDAPYATGPETVTRAPESLPYGRCPHCGAPGVERMGDDDKCESGHVYPSSAAVHAGARDADDGDPTPGEEERGTPGQPPVASGSLDVPADRSAPTHPPEVLAGLERLRNSPPPTLLDVVRLELLRFRGWAADREAERQAYEDLYQRGVV